MRLTLFLFLGLILAASFAYRRVASHEASGGIGTHPGDIGSNPDILAAARGRGHDLAVFAAGCFWGVEAEFRQTPGVVSTAVGYAGGTTDHPTYESLHRGGTGHAESVLVEFDPKVTSYGKLLEVFWARHSPTLVTKGEYRSAILTYGEIQASEANKSRAELETRLGKKVATEIKPAGTFWLAEEYHQQYFEKAGGGTCRIH